MDVVEMIRQSIGGLIAVVGFGTVLRVPKRFLIWGGIRSEEHTSELQSQR